MRGGGGRGEYLSGKQIYGSELIFVDTGRIPLTREQLLGRNAMGCSYLGGPFDPQHILDHKLKHQFLRLKVRVNLG